MRRRLLAAALWAPLAACSRKLAHPPPTPDASAYFDLQPGSRLRIVLPLAEMQGVPTGFEIARYDVAGHRHGRVRLQFTSAEITNDGKTVPEPRAPALPFALPPKPAYIRLLYLQRLSAADHNMAVLAAARMDVLEAATKKIRVNPNSCRSSPEIVCSWVPLHVAVRPVK